MAFTAAASEGECTTCDADNFPEATALLASEGYSPDDYQVLMSWQERARYPGKGFITGYRVAP
ncbi:MAG: hypothetical protein R6V12_13980, partial [Candidatus Hydrogenedentota bacterium]